MVMVIIIAKLTRKTLYKWDVVENVHLILLQPTLRRACGRKSKMVRPLKRKRMGVATNVYLRKTLEKKPKEICEF